MGDRFKTESVIGMGQNMQRLQKASFLLILERIKITEFFNRIGHKTTFMQII